MQTTLHLNNKMRQHMTNTSLQTKVPYDPIKRLFKQWIFPALPGKV